MHKTLAVLSVLALGSWMGCARSNREAKQEYHQAKASYHREQAKGAFETGHPVKGVEEKAKESVEEVKAH
jgi:hypothetical protein